MANRSETANESMCCNDLLGEEKPQTQTRDESERGREKKIEAERDRGNENEARIYEQEKVKLNSFGQEMILSN